MDDPGFPIMVGLLAVPVGVLLFVAGLAAMGRRWTPTVQAGTTLEDITTPPESAAGPARRALVAARDSAGDEPFASPHARHAASPGYPAARPIHARSEEGAGAGRDPYAASAHGYLARAPYGHPAQDPYGAPAQDLYGAPARAPYGHPAQDPYGASARDPYGASARDPYGASARDPYGGSAHGHPAGDPYGDATPARDRPEWDRWGRSGAPVPSPARAPGQEPYLPSARRSVGLDRWAAYDPAEADQPGAAPPPPASGRPPARRDRRSDQEPPGRFRYGPPEPD